MPYPVTKTQVTNPDRWDGSLSSRAARAGMDVGAYAKANIHTDGPVGKLARLYYLQQGVHGSGEAEMSRAGDKRSVADKLYQVG